MDFVENEVQSDIVTYVTENHDKVECKTCKKNEGEVKEITEDVMKIIFWDRIRLCS